MSDDIYEILDDKLSHIASKIEEAGSSLDLIASIDNLASEVAGVKEALNSIAEEIANKPV